MKSLILIMLMALKVCAETNKSAVVSNDAAKPKGEPMNAYWSLKHKDWPPMCASPDPSLQLIPVEGGFIIDDRNYTYPSKEQPLTADSKLKPAPEMFLINSNALAGRPELVEMVRKANISDLERAKQPDSTNDSLRLREEKRLNRYLDELKTRPQRPMNEATNPSSPIPASK